MDTNKLYYQNCLLIIFLLIDPKDYYKYTYATDALGFKYIFDYAERMHQPCVINFSEGQFTRLSW